MINLTNILAKMTKFISEPLDSCNKNLVNTKQSQTIGDYLCQQVRRWLRNDADFKANGRDNIQLPVYYSQCGQVLISVFATAERKHNIDD